MKQSFAMPQTAPESVGAVMATASGEVVVRMRVAQTFHHRGDELGPAGPPAVAPISEVQDISCPAGLRFAGRDAITTRISGYSDGWNYTALVTTELEPQSRTSGRVRMTVEVDSLTWAGPCNVAHPILGVFDVAYRDDITVRCLPAS